VVAFRDAMAAAGGLLDRARAGPSLLSLGVLGVVAILILPVPAGLLDVFFTLSLAGSLVILSLTIFVRSALDFSSFPTVLLVVTTFRLALNVASTRLILSEGHNGAGSAGRVIEAFGHFVMGDNLAIGTIVFTVLMVINFLVITKGSGRIAEVGARFTLDALPGKQMAIDADLSSGLINEAEARRRRRTLEDESSFFGAMDGASKFVKGDAIAGIIIIVVNIVGGLVVGVAQGGLAFGEALKTYTTLSVGDGLVAQIPGLIIATATGLIITKTSGTETTDSVVTRQFARYPDVLVVSGAILVLIGLVPGMPTLLFLTIAILMLGTGLLLARTADGGVEPGAAAAPATAPGDASAEVSDEMRFDELRVELGYALLGMLRRDDGAGLVNAIKNMRRKIARDFGVVVPSIRVQDNVQLEDDEYAVFLREQRIAGGRLMPERLLVLNPGGTQFPFAGIEATDPAFGLPALWIDPSWQAAAEERGATAVDALAVLVTHLGEIVRRQLPQLLSFASVQRLIDGMGEENQKLVQAVMPSPVTVPALQNVLRTLLQDGVPVRNLAEIIEACADAAPKARDPGELAELVRRRIRRTICLHFADPADLRLPAYLYVPRGADGAPLAAGAATDLARLIDAVGQRERARTTQLPPALVVPDQLRPGIAELVRRQRLPTPVLSQSEIDEAVDLIIVERL
jgi:flagellar biosynthesis protein FlhA